MVEEKFVFSGYGGDTGNFEGTCNRVIRDDPEEGKNV